MLRKKISYKPELTRDEVMEICTKKLSYECKIASPKHTTLFLIFKNNFVGTVVRVNQTKEKTVIELIPYIVKAYMRFLLWVLGIAPYLIVYFGPARKFTKEIAGFIDTQPEFKD